MDDESILEGEMSGASEEDAASMFFSEEAARRRVPYTELLRHVLPNREIVGLAYARGELYPGDWEQPAQLRETIYEGESPKM